MSDIDQNADSSSVIDSKIGSDSDSEAYTELSDVPWDWKRFVKPDGEVYFYAQSRRLATTSDLEDPEICKVLQEEADQILGIIEEQDTIQLADWEWYLIYHGGDSPIMGAEFVNHKCFNQAKFHDATEKFIVEDQGLKYWDFLCRFPMHFNNCLPKVEAAFLATIVHGASDRMTKGQGSKFPFNETDCQRLLDIYFDLKRSISDRDLNFNDDDLPRCQLLGVLIWHLACAMEEIHHSGYIRNYGKPEAKISQVTTPKFEWKRTVKYLDIVFGFLLLGTHTTYRRRLWHTWPGSIDMRYFHQLIAGCMQEWIDSTLLATVFVAANVALLAIPDITNAQRTLTVTSTLFCMASILAGVHHNWRHRQELGTDVETRARNDAEFRIGVAYLKYLEGWLGRDVSVTVQACFLSLPIAMLLWAVVTFVAAIGLYSMQNVSVPRRVGFACLVSILLLSSIGTLTYFTRIWPDEAHRTGEETEASSARRRLILRVRELGGNISSIITGFAALTRRNMRGGLGEGILSSSLEDTPPV